MITHELTDTSMVDVAHDVVAILKSQIMADTLMSQGYKVNEKCQLNADFRGVNRIEFCRLVDRLLFRDIHSRMGRMVLRTTSESTCFNQSTEEGCLTFALVPAVGAVAHTHNEPSDEHACYAVGLYPGKNLVELYKVTGPVAAIHDRYSTVKWRGVGIPSNAAALIKRLRPVNDHSSPIWCVEDMEDAILALGGRLPGTFGSDLALKKTIERVKQAKTGKEANVTIRDLLGYLHIVLTYSEEAA